jgi:hypothetical protein
MVKISSGQSKKKNWFEKKVLESQLINASAY